MGFQSGGPPNKNPLRKILPVPKKGTGNGAGTTNNYVLVLI